MVINELSGRRDVADVLLGPLAASKQILDDHQTTRIEHPAKRKNAPGQKKTSSLHAAQRRNAHNDAHQIL